MTTLSRDQRRRKKLEARQQRAIQGKLLHMAMKGKAGPFLAQRQSKPMPPLSRTGERNESCQLPDGTILTARCQVWQNNLYGVAVYDEDHGIYPHHGSADRWYSCEGLAALAANQERGSWRGKGGDGDLPCRVQKGRFHEYHASLGADRRRLYSFRNGAAARWDNNYKDELRTEQGGSP